MCRYLTPCVVVDTRTEGNAAVVILADSGASGTISVVPDSRAVVIGEPGEPSPAYDGTAAVLLSRDTGIYGEVEVTWALTPRDTVAFMQVEGSVTFLDLQQTATITLQVIFVCVVFFVCVPR